MSVVLNGDIADLIEAQTKVGGYSSNEAFVQEAVSVLIKQKIDQGIQAGLEDVKAGRYEEVNADNLDEFLSSLDQ
jgi:Arc/MetJ-type ribon-helix-helix transcriptional regulator